MTRPRLRIRNQTDFAAGLLAAGFGVFVAVYAAVNYKLGTAVRMGPGYFPVWLGGLLALLGFFLALGSLRIDGPPLPRMPLRAVLFVLGGSIVFGYALKPLGLVAATILLVVISAAGGSEFRWREVLALSVALAIFASLVFVTGLGLPFPLWPEIVVD